MKHSKLIGTNRVNEDAPKSLALRGRVGVIDIGSNSVRLVVYDAPTRLPVPIFNERIICGLGRGLEKSGKLNKKGWELALEALARFCGLAKEMRIDQFRVLATAAVRESSDGIKFTNDVESQFGYSVKVLSGPEEAELSAKGILGGAPDADGLLGDLGGGSLELALINSGRFFDGASLPLGYLRLAEAANGINEEAINLIAAGLKSVTWLQKFSGRDLYLVGGIWRVIAKILIEQQHYPLHIIDGYRVSLNSALDITHLISNLSNESLKAMKTIARKRIDTLPISALVLNQLLKITRPREVVFSGSGIREGQFYDLLPNNLKTQDPLISVCKGYAERDGRFARSGEEIAEWVRPLFPDLVDNRFKLVRAVALLSDIGWSEHPDYRAFHSFGRVLRIPIAGISHRDRAILAIAIFVRYNGKKRNEEVDAIAKLISKKDLQLAKLIGQGLRLSYTMCGGVSALLLQSKLSLKNDILMLDMGVNRHLFKGKKLAELFADIAKTMEVGHRIN